MLPKLSPIAVVLADLSEPGFGIAVQRRPYEALKEGAIARSRGERPSAGAHGLSYGLLVISEPRVVLSKVAVAGTIRDEGV